MYACLYALSFLIDCGTDEEALRHTRSYFSFLLISLSSLLPTHTGGSFPPISICRKASNAVLRRPESQRADGVDSSLGVKSWEPGEEKIHVPAKAVRQRVNPSVLFLLF